jgi:hypothetical protein
MAEEQPSLHIDTDWKKQAQEEKRRLAEEEQKRAAEKERSTASSGGPASAGPGSPTAAPSSQPARGRAGSPAAGAARGERQMPEASFPTLVNSLVTQILLYLGDLSPRGAEPQVNLDMAKFNVDLLGVLEDKTKGNLTSEEQKLLDNALYETRMRYVSVASQYATV